MNYCCMIHWNLHASFSPFHKNKILISILYNLCDPCSLQNLIWSEFWTDFAFCFVAS